MSIIKLNKNKIKTHDSEKRVDTGPHLEIGNVKPKVVSF